MKKILIATTALVLTAGAASADMALTGSARMGVTTDGTDTFFSSRVRFGASGSGTTDGGLTFGASYRFDQTGGNADNTANGDSTVFLSGEFGKITMGDVGGAADALVGQTSGVGFGPNDGRHEIGFHGTTKTAVYYEKSVSQLTFGIGAGQVGSDEFSVAAKYATDKFSAALGYESFKVAGASESRISVLGSATFGAATVKAKYATDSVLSGDAYSLSVDGKFGAVAVTAVYTHFGDTDTNIMGLGAAYDLGGGASVKGGVVNDSAGAGTTYADLGVTFSF